MRSTWIHSCLLVGTLGLFIGSSDEASAGLADCGNIHVEAEASCEARIAAECTAQCEPINFTAACSGQLYAECEGECSAEIEASCTASCEGECEASCEVEPGDFECEGECYGECQAECNGNCSAHAEAECEGSDDQAACEAEASARCEGSCDATCDGECGVSCDGTPIEADCEAKCEASCEGQCSAEANADCQIDCQADGFVECETELEGGCTAQCETEDGAIFCDGEYVDHGDNFADCVEALNAVLLANVKLSAEGSSDSSCTGNRCEAEAEGTAKAETNCSISEPKSSRPGVALWAALGLLGLTLSRRRRVSEGR